VTETVKSYGLYDRMVAAGNLMAWISIYNSGALQKICNAPVTSLNFFSPDPSPDHRCPEYPDWDLD
jgi:hypothetical protein